MITLYTESLPTHAEGGDVPWAACVPVDAGFGVGGAPVARAAWRTAVGAWGRPRHRGPRWSRCRRFPCTTSARNLGCANRRGVAGTSERTPVLRTCRSVTCADCDSPRALSGALPSFPVGEPAARRRWRTRSGAPRAPHALRASNRGISGRGAGAAPRCAVGAEGG